MPNLATNLAENLATNLGGSESADWRDSVTGAILNWRWGQGETLSGSDLDSWEDGISADVATAPGASQRPTPHADGDGWDFDSASSTALYTATPDAQAAAIETATELSVHIRLKFATISGQQPFSIADGTNNGEEFNMRMGSGTWQFQAKIANALAGKAVSSTAITAGTNHILSATVDSAGVFKVYLDGQPDTGSATNMTGFPSGLNRFALGVLARLTPAEYFDGKISEVLVANVAHSDAQVLDIYNNMAADY